MKTSDDITAQNVDADKAREGYKIGYAGVVAPRADTVIQYNGLDGRFVPLQITRIINLLSDPSILPQEVEEPDVIPFDIEEKISFNSLDEWSDIIHEYGFYSADVDNIYREYDMQGICKSSAVFRWLKFELYFNLKRKYKGDELFDQIKDKVLYLVKNDPDYKTAMGLETMTDNVYIVLVHAFMKCKIFEKPKPKC